MPSQTSPNCSLAGLHCTQDLSLIVGQNVLWLAVLFNHQVRSWEEDGHGGNYRERGESYQAEPGNILDSHSPCTLYTHLSMTIAANFQSATTSSSSSLIFSLLVMNLISLRMDWSSLTLEVEQGVARRLVELEYRLGVEGAVVVWFSWGPSWFIWLLWLWLCKPTNSFWKTNFSLLRLWY